MGTLSPNIVSKVSKIVSLKEFGTYYRIYMYDIVKYLDQFYYFCCI